MVKRSYVEADCTRCSRRQHRLSKRVPDQPSKIDDGADHRQTDPEKHTFQSDHVAFQRKRSGEPVKALPILLWIVSAVCNRCLKWARQGNYRPTNPFRAGAEKPDAGRKIFVYLRWWRRTTTLSLSGLERPSKSVELIKEPRDCEETLAEARWHDQHHSFSPYPGQGGVLAPETELPTRTFVQVSTVLDLAFAPVGLPS